MSVNIGEVVPDFTAKNHKGEEVKLSDFRGKKNVTLVFFPFAFTGICTGELCEMRDNIAAFQNEKSVLLGISCDTVPTLGIFAAKENYQFDLLSDFWPHGDIAKQFGVFNEERGCAVRGTFIIDKAGKLVWKVTNAIGEARNANDYLEVLNNLA
jgi:mycoredoxin-dependent peroxiredoxin